MWDGRRVWRVSVGAGEVLLELSPTESSGGDDASVERLLWEASSGRSPGVVRVLREIVDRLRGQPSARHREGNSLDPDDEEELRFAAFSGQLQASRVERTGVAALGEDASGAAEDGDDDAVTPSKTDETTTTFFALALTEPGGSPLTNERYQLTLEDGTTKEGRTDKSGKARVTGLEPGKVIVDFPNAYPSEFLPGTKPPATGAAVTVKDGEHAAAIAAKNGFASFKTIWDHPKNADLRALRTNPDVLMAGDEIFIPERKKPARTFATAQEHPFEMARDRVTLRVVLKNLKNDPEADKPFHLEVGDAVVDDKTGGDGTVEQVIEAEETDATLVVDARELSLHIGALDPASELSGVKARLNNLGYDAGDPDDDDDVAELPFAIEMFQNDNGMSIDGQRSPDVESKLTQVHGS